MFPIKPTHQGVYIDIIDRDITQKDLGGGKVLHLIADDTFGPHNPVSGKHPGARPRWARVISIGPEVDEVKPGDLVLCDTMKWSRKIALGRLDDRTVYFWNINVEDILLTDTDSVGDEFLRDLEATLSRMELNIGRL